MKRGYWYIILTAVIFSTMEIALKEVSGSFHPLQMTFTRFLAGGLFLIPFAARTLKKKGASLGWKDIPGFLLLGFVGMVLSMSVYQMSVKEVPASVVAVLFSSNPIFTAVLAFFMLKESIRRNQIAALLLEIGGILAIINPFHISLSPYGVLLAMISTLLFAVYGVMGKQRCARFGGVVVTCASFLCGSAEMLFMILFSRLPMVNKWLAGSGLELFANIPLLSGYSWKTLPWMLMICIVNTGLGFACYFKAMEETSAQETSLVFFLKPVLAPVFAFFILGEVISWNMGLGIAFILIGSLLALLPGLRAVQKLPKTPGA